MKALEPIRIMQLMWHSRPRLCLHARGRACHKGYSHRLLGVRFTIVALFLACLAQVVAQAAVSGNLIQAVPDWNEPAAYSVNGYNQWCSPTAGANIMGYWEDVKGCVGLTDRTTFGQSNPPAYPGTQSTWQQGLYHDGMVELGWFMNTGNWQTNAGAFPPNNTQGTSNSNIGTGLLNYATSSWTDNAYPQSNPAQGTGIAKVAYPNTTVSRQYLNMIGQGQPPLTLQMIWDTYKAEIDAGRPVECTFEYWVDPGQPGPDKSISGLPGITVQTYAWATGAPHSAVGVGYIDITTGFQNDGQDEWFVCQDGLAGTGRYVAVPLDTSYWLQNDYVTNVPEPATLSLLALGAATALIRRRRRE